jgi:hypothetical protein
MATGSSEKRRINFRLVHDGVQPGTPVDEPLRFGLQDKNGEVHLGALRAKGVWHFDFSVDVKETGNSSLPDFGGAFVHGPPSLRFLYLSWKREGVHSAPWAWRIKNAAHRNRLGRHPCRRETQQMPGGKRHRPPSSRDRTDRLAAGDIPKVLNYGKL